ncbi:MAG: multidrug transporter [Desulfuromonas sp.]|nr:MAG: multidrug transporter [Desulfuromonas sp.]
MTRMRLLLPVLFLLLAGCTMAPRYQRPDAPVSDNWPTNAANQVAGEASAQVAADIPWRDFFVDPQLQALIEQALQNNRDLRVALLNIERYQAQYRIERSALLPSINATGSGLSQRLAEDLSGTGQSQLVRQYSATLGASAYEFDLFGRVRSLKDQALQQYLATEQARRSVQISLIAQVANGYLTLAADNERLQLARETLANQQDAYDLVKHRFDTGVASALDLNQARTSVEAAKVDKARFTTLVAQDVNGLTLVVGAPLDVTKLPTELSAELSALQGIPAGLPSTVLLERPDILAAEHRLLAANANIGAARAAFFPRIALTGTLGTGSDELSGLFTAGSETWMFAPQITLPIFTAGSNLARLKVAKVDRDIAVAEYEKAIQTAFREVADSLAQSGTIDEQLAAQQALTDASSESYRISQARYDKGVDSYLTVLDSQRALYAARQNLIGTRLTRLTSLVTMYKVFGGGSL